MAITKVATPVVKPPGRPINGSVDMAVTERAVFSDPGGDDCFVPGWDRYTGNEQGMSRTVDRARLGKKKTPIGRGVLVNKGMGTN